MLEELNLSTSVLPADLLKKYEITSCLGYGGFGIILKAKPLFLNDATLSEGMNTHNEIKKKDGFKAIKVIMKTLHLVPKKMHERYGLIPLEAYILLTLSHPHIVSLYEVIQNDQAWCLVMECPRGFDLDDLDQDHHLSEPEVTSLDAGTQFSALTLEKSRDLFEFIESGKMDDRKARLIFYQLLKAVQYLHDRNICHGDIKDENILVDGNMNIKLIDFGSSNIVHGDACFLGYLGTFFYAPPEVFLGICFDGFHCDMWALGVILYIMHKYEPPFLSVDEILHKNVVPMAEPKPIERIIGKLLVKDRTKRPTVSEILCDEWFHGVEKELLGPLDCFQIPLISELQDR